jgi:hypothetical protein
MVSNSSYIGQVFFTGYQIIILANVTPNENFHLVILEIYFLDILLAHRISFPCGSR